MWSFGIYCLKLSETEFWSLTPAKFWSLQERYESEQEQEDYRAGIIATQIYNAHRGKAKAIEWLDFFPFHKKRRQLKEANRQITPKEAKLRERLALANYKKMSKARD